jgi:hypothetical protein
MSQNGTNCLNLYHFEHAEGKFKGLPTKQHIILILHGYSPDNKLYLEK